MNCLLTKNGNIKSTKSSIIDFFCNYIAPKFNFIVTAGPMTSIVQQQSSGYRKHVMSIIEYDYIKLLVRDLRFISKRNCKYVILYKYRWPSYGSLPYLIFQGILFQILVKIFQNLISLGTVHKCGETHNTLMGGDISSYNEVTGLPKVQKLKALKDSGLFAKVRRSCQTSLFLRFFRLFSRFKCL